MTREVADFLDRSEDGPIRRPLYYVAQCTSEVLDIAA